MKIPISFEAFAFAPICRPSKRPKEALDALERMGVKDVSLENRLEVRADSETAEIVLIGAIGKSWWDDSGITEKEVRDALDSIPKGKPINIKINSEGGSVKEGLGIYNAILERNKDIQTRITGYALSIASVFPLAAKKSLGGRGVVSPKSAIWMEHRAWSWAQGNAADMRQAADMLDAHDETLIDIYAGATGNKKAAHRDRMQKETWTKGGDAVAAGLADETDADETQAAYRPLHPDFISRCKNISPEILNALSSPKQGANNQPTEEPNMNRTQKIALLNSWGVNVKDESSVTDARLDELIALGKTAAVAAFNGTTTPAPATTATATSTVSREEFDAVKLQLAKANEKRVEDRVLTYVEAGKITNEEAQIFVKAAIGDEKGTFEILDKKEVSFPGAAGVGYTGIEILDGPTEPGTPEGLTGLRGPQSEMLINIRKEHKTPEARLTATQASYRQAIKQAIIKDNRKGWGRDVFGANTYSGTLVTSFLMDLTITDLQNAWAFLNSYTLASGVDPFKPLATGVAKHVTVGEATQTDPTNFEPSDGSTVAPISVAMHWYNQPCRVGATDLNQGLRIEDLRTKALGVFSDKITQVAIVPITAAIFTATPVISAPAAFGLSDLATLQGQLQKSPIKNLILDGTYKSRVTNTPGFFQPTGTDLGSPNGFQNFGWNGIYLASNWTTAGTNIKGFACNPQAIIRANGLPLNPPNIPGGSFQTTTFELPGLNIAVAMSTWFSLGSRTMFVSWDVIFGVKEADTTAGVVIASGTPS